MFLQVRDIRSLLLDGYAYFAKVKRIGKKLTQRKRRKRRLSRREEKNVHRSDSCCLITLALVRFIQS